VTSTQKTISVDPSMTGQQACEIYGPGEDAVAFALLQLTQQLAVQVAKTAATRHDEVSETGLDPSMARRSWQRSIDVWQMPRWIAAVAVLLACVCFWQALPVSSRPGATPAVAGHAGKSQNDAPLGRSLNSNRKLLTRRIDEIRPGMRVLAENPELHGIDVPQLQIDQESTRLVRFHQAKPDGYELTVDRLMSTEELAEAAVDVLLTQGPPNDARPWVGKSIDVNLWNTLLGQTLHVELPEMGVEGPATIVSIEPCPAIEPDDGTGRRLVTSTFKHTVSQVINLQIEGEDQPIGTTPNHPFWSEDRQAFVRADSLRVGERLLQADGVTKRIVSSMLRPRLSTNVYNLEVESQHVYHVGVGGALVHNSCPAPLPLTRRPHGLPAHDRIINQWIRRLTTKGTGMDLRKNQALVDQIGNKLTNYRPDLQWTDQNGARHILQVVHSNPVTRIAEFLAVDPNLIIHIVR